MIRIRGLDNAQLENLEDVFRNWREYVDIVEVDGFTTRYEEFDVIIHDEVPVMLKHYNGSGHTTYLQVGESIMSVNRNSYEKLEIF